MQHHGKSVCSWCDGSHTNEVVKLVIFDELFIAELSVTTRTRMISIGPFGDTFVAVPMTTRGHHCVGHVVHAY